jgi:signal transduction histidine kinase
MAARVAHEVRNPLNAINGAAHFLATEYADDEIIEKFTSLIKRQSGRVDQVASDILYAAKPLRLARTSVDVDAVVDQVLASLREEIEGQGISVERHADPELPRLQADELQIEQAFTNIIRNAVESMPHGGTLSIGTAEDAGGGWLRISVQDTGSGIRPEDRGHIFQTFYTTKAKGTGLGLSIVEGVLKNHGGKIFIEQPDGAGTRVVLCLPALGDAGGSGQAKPETAPSPRPEASPKKTP